MSYLERLNDKQKEAVLCTEGPLLVLAGAGSGKTSMMTCRIAYLIDELGVSPYNILAVTFTNKAAGEMRERVDKILAGLDNPRTSDNLLIATFHSACLRILRVHADLLGYGKDFVVYDTSDQKTVVKGIIKDMNLDTKRYTPQYLLSVIGDCKEKCLDPEGYLRVNGENFRSKVVYEVYKAYENILRKNNAMDFDDLLLNVVRLFEREPEVLGKYQRRFRYIMVDEYQDTNTIQYKFVKYLAEGYGNICVVGDDDQCIYEWRGADIRNILDFEKDFRDAKVIKLEQNYRSCSNILKAAHSVIKKNRGRKDKELWTTREDGDKLVYHLSQDERDEVRYVAEQISKLKNEDSKEGRPLGYSDFAVLYRTNAQSRAFEEGFRLRGIPCKVVGNLGFYDRKEIKDVMCYLRLVQNPKDDVSLERIINEPKRGIGEKTMEKLKALAEVRGESLLETLSDREVTAGLSAKAEAAINELADLINGYHTEIENMTVAEIYDGLLARSGYLPALQAANTVEAESRIENILELRSAIDQFQKEQPAGTLMEFLEGKALASDSDKLPDGNEEEDEKEKVLLMTLHTAKGLEFPVVFMPGMEEGLFPGFRAMDRPEGLEEERRLCYVGITRAKEKLFLTGAKGRTLYGKWTSCSESSFIREIDPILLERDTPVEPKKSVYRDGYAEKPSGSPFRGGSSYAAKSAGSVASGIMSQNRSASAPIALSEGDRVAHAKFGEGTVTEVSPDGKTGVIIFDSEGRKKMALGIAPIKKI